MPGWPGTWLRTSRASATCRSSTATARVDFAPADVIYVNAGATRPAGGWLDGLRDGGRLILPLTGSGFPRGAASRGVVFKISRRREDYAAQRISGVAIFPCAGMRDAPSEAALKAAIDGGRVGEVRRLYRRGDVAEGDCWIRGADWCLAYRRAICRIIYIMESNQAILPLTYPCRHYIFRVREIRDALQMANSVFDARALRDEQAAYTFIEARLWANGRVCPHCGVVDRSGLLKGKSTRAGVYKCYACRKPFTVKVGTIFEDSHAPMHLWLQAIVMMCASKKGISSNQLHRVLGVTLRTAWHMSHRIRLAMDGSSGSSPIGGLGKIVEADETYITRSPKTRRPNDAPIRENRQVLSLVERGGPIRSVFLDHGNVRDALWRHLDRDSTLHTDGAATYRRFVVKHHSVDHSKEEWVRDLPDGTQVHTNTLEGFFSIFKRGLIGVYQHIDERHLHRYLAEFDFRYNNRAANGVNDTERAARAIDGVVGKRLTYQTARSQAAATA